MYFEPLVIEQMTDRYNDLDPERLDGMTAIRDYIDPRMSLETFYRYWRKRLEPILMEHPQWGKHRRKRYFTYKRLILAIMLEYLKPGTVSQKWRREDRAVDPKVVGGNGVEKRG